jgi:hypothetical protein
MEALGAAGSIVGIAAAAIQSASVLHEFFGAIKDAPEEIQSLHERIGSIHAVLVDVRRIACTSTQPPPQSLIRALEICGLCFDKIRQLAVKFEEERWKNSAAGSWVRKFRFAFQRMDIATTLKKLEEQKSTLLLAMAVLEGYTCEINRAAADEC